MRSIDSINVTNKRVILRIDANVPVDDGRVLDNFRLKAVLPTIHHLVNRKAKVILISHLGRPGGVRDDSLSMKKVFSQLSALLNQKVTFATKHFSETTKKAIDQLEPGEVLALENLRFDKGEENNSRTFARRLAEYGEIYVNDAFAVTHREAASTVAITEFLPSYAGLLLEKEVRLLQGLLRHPEQPFVVIVGGAKVKDKLPLIKHLLPHASQILVGGGIANTFAAAKGFDVKESLCESTYYALANDFVKRSHGKIVVPTDFVWKKNKIVDIGPRTLEQYCQIIERAKTVFWNGSIGVTEEGYKATEVLAKAIAESKATSIAGGGNTVESITDAGVLKQLTFVSTGGGATLEYLSGQSLPGLKALHFQLQ